MKRRLIGAAGWVTVVSMLGTAQAAVNEPGGMNIAHCLSLLDLDHPELAAVRQAYAAGHLRDAMQAYRDVLVRHLATLKPAELPSAWLWSPTQAAELLNQGIVTTTQYGGTPGSRTRYAIGRPGEVDWSKKPSDGYLKAVRDISTMHWTNCLGEAFVHGNDPRDASAWIGYWADFARNWRTAQAKNEKDKQLLQVVGKSIQWPTGSILYFAWRTENFSSGLQAMAKAHPDALIKALDLDDLAAALTFEATYDLPHAVKLLQREGGVPNQRLSAIRGLLHSSIVLVGFKQAAQWQSMALDSLGHFFGRQVLADGTGTEQSFNYNKGLPATVESIRALMQNLPDASLRQRWDGLCQRVGKYRQEMLRSLWNPAGFVPSIGNANPYTEKATWPMVRDATVAEGGGPVPHDPIGKTPAFTSIYFPYGGYAALRSGWDASAFYAFFKNSRPGLGHLREGGNGFRCWAYGKPLLINSGASQYSRKGNYSQYFYSTVSQNSICVDGYTQLLDAGKTPLTYTQPIPARWHTGRRLDFIEGEFSGPYGGWNFLTDGAATDSNYDQTVKVSDVTHRRGVYFLREQGVWIIVDRIHSGGRHRYTQSWCLPDTWKPSNIALDEQKQTIIARIAGEPGVELHQFGAVKPKYTDFYGIHRPDQILGWVSRPQKDKPDEFTPAPDLHADWTADGDQLLVTLIVPNSNGTSRLKSIQAAPQTGFDAVLRDGTQIRYRASQKPEKLTIGEASFDGEDLLQVSDANSQWGARLAGDGRSGGEVFDETKTQPIGIPTGFSWQTTPAGVWAPDYQQDDALLKKLRND